MVAASGCWALTVAEGGRTVEESRMGEPAEILMSLFGEVMHIQEEHLSGRCNKGASRREVPASW